MTSPWRPTSTLLRAALVSLATIGLAVLVGRPDLLVLAVPLLVFTGYGVLYRPPRAAGHAHHPDALQPP